MSNPLERRRNLLEEQNYKSNFNFTEFNIVDKDKSELLVLEEKIKSSQMTFVKSTLEIGNILSQAQDKLKSYGTGSFMKWYENIGFNKDNVSYFLKRYELSIIYPEKKEYIAEMPVRLVKELTKKDIEPEIVVEAIKEEIKTTKQFNEIKINYSHGANIEKVKLVKTSVEAQEIFNLLQNKLGNKVSNEEIEEIVKEMFEKFKFIRK
ncbi:MAG: hypothetical protein KA384_08395 [Leptotrichiaceae bacterium]|jgi:hypothetical protein|nr:hypothetical protein [Leptotrichiaceae bacterium]MBP9479790.1 hypothetical protein [Sebaldella sp.]MBU9918561.1 hypothetical protein [Fusobacteriaceae bacterium]